ncbi:tRNA modification GTPase [Mesoterricola sediminis]|uniref:tRNA modification GTPase MnmE n=1 Tax=Mesoterricola sediminis TaxID=2927980 RepID=A0AA48H3F9_9BACT|nr:tRNA modification GTPase [Mesoterricola sediminis]BDU78887.1 tRNA modification GTPase MnmE [Mesoterricola sediminis]
MPDLSGARTGPICAPATPLVPAAVAVVRLSGDSLAERLVSMVALPPPRMAQVRTLAWDGFRERALVLHFPAPHSYTGEDVVEFQVHGNPLLVRRLLDHLATLGIRGAEPGEFTRRALLNGKVDLLGAEALRDLVGATTDAQLRQAQARSGGAPPWVARAKAALAPWVARAEACVDYGEEEGIGLDLTALAADLDPLRRVFHVEQERAAAARWLRDGIRVVLAGRPNAGKSTLFNALAGQDRAIVTEHPGTTRDVIDVAAQWADLPLHLLDTAGLRESQDPVERLGVARVGEELARADLILHLVPLADAAPDPAVEAHLAPYAAKVLRVRTQADLGGAPDPGAPCVSAATGDLAALAEALRTRFLGAWSPDACLGALDTRRQRELLDELAAQADLLTGLDPATPPEIAASLLQGAWSLLARLTGEDRAETALDQVFSGFCLGK